MTPKKRQIKYQLEQLDAAFMQVRAQWPKADLFVGMQLQRLDVLAHLMGIPWDRNDWLDKEGTENDLEL